jgi:hypothetical protein
MSNCKRRHRKGRPERGTSAPLSSKPSNRASHFAVDLRPPRLRLSGPANQRFASVAPSRRRSLSRRSASLRNLHEQFVGIVQASKGKRGASRSKTRLPVACFAAAQHLMRGASETARKSPLVFDRLGLTIGVGFFAGCSREAVPNNFLSTLIMTVFHFFPSHVPRIFSAHSL